MSAPAPSDAAASGSKRHQPAAAAERRVQPRHFHKGSNRASVASGAKADGPPPAARLYRHALECVFAFLSQRELAFALRVSRGWLAAVKSMASLRLEVVQPKADLRVVAASAMGHHVDQLKSVHLDGATLAVLASRMGNLRALICELALPPATQPLAFPAALRRLSINLSGPPGAERVNAAIAAISRLSLLEDLDIGLDEADSQISFAPLAALPRLRNLEFRCADAELALSDAQVDQLRDLPRLQGVFLPLMTTDTLRRLLRQPHDLQWQEISLPIPLDNEAAALLPQLPSLTKIKGRVACSRFDWLRGLPNLTVVDLIFEGPEAAGRAESLVAGLQSCTNIELLSLDGCSDLTAAHLAELLPQLPRLRELTLSGLNIESLSFLTQPPLTLQLSALMLAYCQQLPLVELRHVHALRGLKQLGLCCSFTAPLDEYCRSLYEPPSLLLPRLEKFSYSAPEEEGDESEDDQSEVDGSDEDESAEDEPDDYDSEGDESDDDE